MESTLFTSTNSVEKNSHHLHINSNFVWAIDIFWLLFQPTQSISLQFRVGFVLFKRFRALFTSDVAFFRVRLPILPPSHSLFSYHMEMRFLAIIHKSSFIIHRINSLPIKINAFERIFPNYSFIEFLIESHNFVWMGNDQELIGRTLFFFTQKSKSKGYPEGMWTVHPKIRFSHSLSENCISLCVEISFYIFIKNSFNIVP